MAKGKRKRKTSGTAPAPRLVRRAQKPAAEDPDRDLSPMPQPGPPRARSENGDDEDGMDVDEEQDRAYILRQEEEEEEAPEEEQDGSDTSSGSTEESDDSLPPLPLKIVIPRIPQKRNKQPKPRKSNSKSSRHIYIVLGLLVNTGREKSCNPYSRQGRGGRRRTAARGGTCCPTDRLPNPHFLIS